MATAYINERVIDYASLKSRVLNGASPLAVQKFDALNAHLPRNFVPAGQIVILPSDTVLESTTDEAWLMQRAEEISRVLDYNPRDGEVVVGEYDLLQSVLGYSSLGISSATSAWSSHLNDLRSTLQDIERAYGRFKSGAVDKETFFRQRQELLKQLNNQLQGAARLGTGLRGNRSLKGILGISSKSFFQKNEIKHYGERLERIAGLARHLRHGTAIGLALDMTATGLEVKEACTLGREATCRKAQFVEGGRLVGSVGGAYIGGSLGGAIGRSLCNVFMGVATKRPGNLVCEIIGGASGGYVGGASMGSHGAQWGETLYVGDDPWI